MTDGERVKAVVVPRPDARVVPEEPVAYRGARIAEYKVLRAVEPVEALPKRPTGTVLKREPRAEADAGRGP